MSVYIKQVGKITVKITMVMFDYGSRVTKANLLIDNRDQFSLGYILGSRSWHSSTCFSDYDEVKSYLPLLQEMLDIFDDGEFTDRDLKMLGYKLSTFGVRYD